MLPTYDYQGTAAPAQRAALSDLVVMGFVAEAVMTGDELWLVLRNATRVIGSGPLDTEVRVRVDTVVTASFDPGLLQGLEAMAFLIEDGHGGLLVALEGLWLSCDIDGPAAPALLEPVGEGWPIAPTIRGIRTLVVDPPLLVDGPVVRRSGMRDFAAVGAFVPGQLDRPAGVLSLDAGCLSLVTNGNHTPLIWPPGTTWGGGGSTVLLADGTSLVVGAGLTPEGTHLPAFAVQYVLGDQAQQALEACATVVGNREAAVLVISDL